MKPRRFIRVGTSNPEEYEKITIEKVTCDYYLKVFGELRRLDDKLEEDIEFMDTVSETFDLEKVHSHHQRN